MQESSQEGLESGTDEYLQSFMTKYVIDTLPLRDDEMEDGRSWGVAVHAESLRLWTRPTNSLSWDGTQLNQHRGKPLAMSHTLSVAYPEIELVSCLNSLRQNSFHIIFFFFFSFGTDNFSDIYI